MKNFNKKRFNRLRDERHGSNPFNVVKVAFSPKAFEQIRKTIGSRRAESGGALFGKPEDLKSAIPYITEFVFDDSASTTSATYTINTSYINPIIHKMWDENGLELHGLIHSHPYGCSHPSGPDMDYFHRMHTYMDRPFLITPIVFTKPDGGFKMFCYLVGPDTPAIEVEYCVMNEAEYKKAIKAVSGIARQPVKNVAEATMPDSSPQSEESVETPCVSTAEENVKTEVEVVGIDYQCEENAVDIDVVIKSKILITSVGEQPVKNAAEAAMPDSTPQSEESVETPCASTAEKDVKTEAEVIGIDYQCEENAVDIDVVKHSKIVITGVGGFYEGSGMFARCGIGEIIAIDPDVVEAKNLCRQGYLLRQIGMHKVEALGEYVREINPDVEFKGYPVKLQDLTPEEEEDIFGSASLAIFTTDSFEAQAYGNKIALKYNIPAIWGGFYEKSLASEIFFYIPGVTPGCFRCAVSPRYKAQEEFRVKNNGKEYNVSSSCNTIFHSALLDAQIGMLAMAIIHNKIEGKTFSGWFGEHFDRNLIQMNVNPQYHSNLFDRTFTGDTTYIFESVWQHIEAEVPPKYELCPDCHGGSN